MRRWAIDSEFLSGEFGGATTCITLSNGAEENHIFWADEKQRFFEFVSARPFLHTLFIWNLAPEYGSLEDWGGDLNFDPEADKINRAWLTLPNGLQVQLFDVQPFFRTMGKELASLENAGKFLSKHFGEELFKFDKPLFLGLRHPSLGERPHFAKYALQDAKVTARAAEYLLDELIFKGLGKKIGLRWLNSFGTVSAKFFKLPMVGQRLGKKTILAPWHSSFRDHSVFAGRSEAFINGEFRGRNFYNDMKKQYSLGVLHTGALMTRYVEPLKKEEAKKIDKVTDFESVTGCKWGWLKGTFTSANDLWGLPVRSNERNYYVTGTRSGLFHTYDLMAAKAEIVELGGGFAPDEIAYGSKPILEVGVLGKLHHKFLKLYDDTISGRVKNPTEIGFNKAVMNALTGRMGLRHPHESARTNYVGYNAIVAWAHWQMSQVFDRARQKDAGIFYMDTDSIFSDKNLAGHYWDVADAAEEYVFPVVLEVKGESDLLRIARSKMYYQSEHSAGWSAWHPQLKFFWEIMKSLPDQITVGLETKRTFRTRNKKALEMVVGRWQVEPVAYDYQKICQLFKADDKRVREEYNSYQLFRDGKFSKSRAPSMNEFSEITGEVPVWIGLDGTRYSDPFIQEFKRANKIRPDE